MAKKSNGIDETLSGRKRVRLEGKNSRPGKSHEHMKKMREAGAKSRAEAPRHGRGKGFAGNNHKYKRLLEVHRNSKYAPNSRVVYDEDAEIAPNRNVPLFIKKTDVADKMIEMLSRGVPPSTVCRYAGVHYTTFRRWMEVGAEGTNPVYTEFLDRVAKAEAKAEITLLGKMDAFHDEDWKSVAWMLERRWPENWARRDRHEISGELIVNKKEKLAKQVVDNPEALELARKILEDGTEVYELPGDGTIDDV